MLGKNNSRINTCTKYLLGVSEILHRGGCNNFVSGDYQVWEIISEYFVVFPKLEKDGSYGGWNIRI